MPSILKTILSIYLLVFALHSFAQIEHGGRPVGLEMPLPEFILLNATDIEAFKIEDEVNDLDKSVPYRFGKNIPTDLDSDRHGSWSTLSNGDRLWRLAVSSKHAVSLNFQFDIFDLPENGKVFVYSSDKKQIKGSFTRENVSDVGSLGVGFIFSESLIIEYVEPKDHLGEGFLHIDLVTHGYRNPLEAPQVAKSGPFGNSGACNVNVNCPAGQPFEFERRSVAIIVVGSNGICSGALVNNANRNQQPLFLTANHCISAQSAPVSNWVFYFNHESPICTGTTGRIDQSISGAQILARSAESDFALLMLNNAVPQQYDVCFSGWNANDNPSTVSSAFSIHHPRGDIKKICIENDAPYHKIMPNVAFVNQTWFIDQWELGVTEPGSSGAPLFDQNGLIIGVLSGGNAACAGTVNNGQSDFFGRIGVAWSFGGSPTTQLRNWLDPQNTGILILENSCASSPQPNDISLLEFDGIEDMLCESTEVGGTLKVFNAGEEDVSTFTLHFSVNDSLLEPYIWNGLLTTASTVVVEIPELPVDEGENHLVAQVISVNNAADINELGNELNAYFYRFQNIENYNLRIELDDYPDETTWSVTSIRGITLHSGGPYTSLDNIVNTTFCLGEDFCFNFNMFDSGNDGLCCTFGQGSYTLTNASGEVVASGAQFGGSRTTRVCNTIDTLNSQLTDRIFLYPNPANDEVTMILRGLGGKITTVSITDLQGRRVANFTTPTIEESGRTLKLPTSFLAEGLYIVNTMVDGQSHSSKLLIVR